MPQTSRFRRIQFVAWSREASTLVISATSSSLSPFGLAQQQSGLLGQREADLFTGDWRGENTAAFFAPFVDFLHASLGGRRLMRRKIA